MKIQSIQTAVTKPLEHLWKAVPSLIQVPAQPKMPEPIEGMQRFWYSVIIKERIKEPQEGD